MVFTVLVEFGAQLPGNRQYLSLYDRIFLCGSGCMFCQLSFFRQRLQIPLPEHLVFFRPGRSQIFLFIRKVFKIRRIGVFIYDLTGFQCFVNSSDLIYLQNNTSSISDEMVELHIKTTLFFIEPDISKIIKGAVNHLRRIQKVLFNPLLSLLLQGVRRIRRNILKGFALKPELHDPQAQPFILS